MITASGLGSGIDVSGIVSQLVAAEGQPSLARLDRKEAVLQTQISAMGALKGAISELGSSLKELQEAKTFNGVKNSISGDRNFSASADESALLGNYRISVEALAQSQSLASERFSDRTDSVGTGTLTIELGTFDSDSNTFTAKADTSPVSITIDGTNNSLEAIRDAINEADAGVSASIVNDGSGYRLAIRSDKTGQENGVRITAVDDDGNNSDASGLSQLAYDPAAGVLQLTETAAARDAEIRIDGLTITSPTNTVQDAIEGVTLTLLTEDPGNSAELSLKRDTGLVSRAVESFIEKYNAFSDLVAQQTSYDPATGSRGPLIGDATVRGISSNMRQLITGGLDSDTFGTLSELGIGFNRDGKLELDSSKLTAAVEANPEALSQLFSNENNSGFADRLTEYADGLLASDGLLTGRIDGMNNRIEDIGDSRSALNDRLERVEARYLKQFNAMDRLVGQLNAQSAFLAQQLAALPGFTRASGDQ